MQLHGTIVGLATARHSGLPRAGHPPDHVADHRPRRAGSRRDRSSRRPDGHRIPARPARGSPTGCRAAGRPDVRSRRARRRLCSRSACCGSMSRAARWPCRRGSRAACRRAASKGRATRCARRAHSRALSPWRPPPDPVSPGRRPSGPNSNRASRRSRRRAPRSGNRAASRHLRPSRSLTTVQSTPVRGSHAMPTALRRPLAKMRLPPLTRSSS